MRDKKTHLIRSNLYEYYKEKNPDLDYQGIVDLMDDADKNKVVNNIPLVNDVDVSSIYSETVAYLEEKYNVEIAGGFGQLAGAVWRIGVMGYSSRKENVTLLLSALGKLLG